MVSILYIAYGKDDLYHEGVIFNWLRLSGKNLIDIDIQVLLYTDRPDWYDGYPFKVEHITPSKLSEWSCDGRYHFRIKNRVLNHALRKYDGDFLYLDSDILLKKPVSFFAQLIKSTICLVFKDEGPAELKEGGYRELIHDPKNKFKNFPYTRTKPHMYGSAVIGIRNSSVGILDLADKLMLDWLPKIQAHTVEQFSLTEAVIRSGLQLKTVDKFTTNYSSSGRKAYARGRIEEFFKKFERFTLTEKQQIASTWRLERTLSVLISQKVKKFRGAIFSD